MKLTPRFMIRAGLVLSAAGAIGAFGACKDKGITPPPPPTSPPPPAAPAAPINVAATAKSTSQIDVSWTDASENEDGFKVESCSGAGCTNFAEIGSVAANATTFSNINLTANTDYSYRVKAFNAAGSNLSPVASGKTSPVQPAKVDGILIGAGEITSCGSVNSRNTALLVDAELAKNPSITTVFTVGNNLNDTTTAGRSYATCFDPTWGKFKTGMRAAVGQQDYASVGQGPMYSYFGDRVSAPNGWYSFDVGANWHVIVLNTATWQWGTNNMTGADPNLPAPMLDWLQADLAANKDKPCIMAISWERRLYTAGSGDLGKNFNMKHISGMLYGVGVDVLVSAKDKLYARFAQTDPDGNKDAAKGFRQFIVGTGGRSLDQLVAATPTNPVEAQQASTQGVIKFTLNSDSYTWEFIPTTPGGFTDTGTTKCH